MSGITEPKNEGLGGRDGTGQSGGGSSHGGGSGRLPPPPQPLMFPWLAAPCYSSRFASH